MRHTANPAAHRVKARLRPPDALRPRAYSETSKSLPSRCSSCTWWRTPVIHGARREDVGPVSPYGQVWLEVSCVEDRCIPGPLEVCRSRISLRRVSIAAGAEVRGLTLRTSHVYDQYPHVARCWPVQAVAAE
eukprot:767471-Hanusia_phi.AAC.2